LILIVVAIALTYVYYYYKFPVFCLFFTHTLHHKYPAGM